MLPLNLEPGLDLNSDVDKVFKHLVHLLRSRNITLYVESHPAAYHEVLAAVQELPQPKPFPTPGSTPREEPDSGVQADQHKNDLVGPLNQRHLAQKQESDQGDDADDSSVEQTSDDFQRSVSLDIWPPSGSTYDQGVRQDQFSDPTIISSTALQLAASQRTSSKRKQDFDDDGASKRTQTELIDPTEVELGSSSVGYPTRWTYEEFAVRYYMLVPSLSRASGFRDLANDILVKVVVPIQGEGSDKYQLGLTEIFYRDDMLPFLENLRTTRLDHCAIVIQKNLKARHYRRKYLEVRRATLLIQSITRRYLAWKHIEQTRKIDTATIIAFQSLWRGKCTRRRCEELREAETSSDTVGQEELGNDGFAQLPAHWQTQLQRITSLEALQACKLFCHQVRHPITTIDMRPDRDALERIGGSDEVPTKDRRLKQLKFLLEDGNKKENALEDSKWLLEVSGRVHLAELAEMYEAEKALPVKRGQPSANERFTDLLFPDTMKYKEENESKGKKGRKGKKGSKGKKGNQLCDQQGQQMAKARADAKGKLEYWLRLAKPLWEMAQSYGFPILILLPREVTPTSLHALRKDDRQAVVDYIGHRHPGLKEQISNLSLLLPDIIQSELPSKRLVIETISHDELLNHSFEELFQFSNEAVSSRIGDLPLEEPSEIPGEIVDAQQADAAVGPFAREHADEQLPSTHISMQSVQSIRPEGTTRSFRSQSSGTDSDDEDISNSTTDYSMSAHPSACQESCSHDQEPNLRPDTPTEDLSAVQDDDSSINLEPAHIREHPVSQGYFVEGVDWRAQQPSGNHGEESLQPYESSLQISGASVAGFSDFDSYIISSP